jgi:hypothetical protein
MATRLDLASNLLTVPATDYGSDVAMEPDFDETWTLITGRRVMAERLVRRFTTPKGTLPFWPDDGFDVRDWLREEISRATLHELRQSLVNEGEKDEQLLSLDVSITFNPSSETLSVTLSCVDADGPFTLVLNVSALTVDLLIPDTVS